MSPRRQWSEPELARLLAATRAEADAAPLARALARLAARPAPPAWAAWLARPAAVAVAAGLLVASVAVSGLLLQDAGTPDGGAALVSTLLGDDGTFGLPLAAPHAGAAGADSGGSPQ